MIAGVIAENNLTVSYTDIMILENLITGVKYGFSVFGLLAIGSSYTFAGVSSIREALNANGAENIVDNAKGSGITIIQEELSTHEKAMETLDATNNLVGDMVDPDKEEAKRETEEENNIETSQKIEIIMEPETENENIEVSKEAETIQQEQWSVENNFETYELFIQKTETTEQEQENEIDEDFGMDM